MEPFILMVIILVLSVLIWNVLFTSGNLINLLLIRMLNGNERHISTLLALIFIQLLFFIILLYLLNYKLIFILGLSSREL